MLRTTPAQGLLRALTAPKTAYFRTSFKDSTTVKHWQRSEICTLSLRRPRVPVIATYRAFASPRWQSTQKSWDKVDKKVEEAIGKRKLEPHPELVSSTSSVHPIFGEVGVKDDPKDIDMMKELKSDVSTIKDTFNLEVVPQQAYVIGLAGVLPYLATSLSTVFCAWEINNATGNIGLLLKPQTAEYFLHILEPLQVGYGAVIISFLGAIHWGLEWAGFGGNHGYKRYAIGVLAPAIAWPTILLPLETALITQFCAFTVLYYVDTRATKVGWTPPWYSTYRFVLTFIVGASIVVSLIGRGQIGDKVDTVHGLMEKYAPPEGSTEVLLKKERDMMIAEKIAQEKKKEAEGTYSDKKKTSDQKKDSKTNQGEGKEKKDGEKKDGSKEEGDGKEGNDTKSKDDGRSKDDDEEKDNSKEGDSKEKGNDKKGSK